ncbi:S24 family peptidase [Sphingomonas sp. CL5.1]|uniref:S24 family peptidase n=1 Tax=Sphingomonas sp. CL5.1 TaxID=2653203 RepID=UPI0015841063|nr:S24 family peptidase [Sphingomonas sp. CL5.1]QKR99528.1 S24 family peptidase [Sphingomonas sp. CL5.1]
MSQDPREALMRLASARGVSLAALSAMLGRNVAYLQQFVGRGSPKRLAEEDRRALAAFFDVEERVLGGAAAGAALVEVPWLALSAAAGAGADAADERRLRVERFAPETLAAAGIAPRTASIIMARGDSMAPTILDGDRLVVDRGDRRIVRTPAIFVARRDGDLLVKRVTARGDTITLASDNPAYPPLTLPEPEVEVIGRVKLLLRAPA